MKITKELLENLKLTGNEVNKFTEFLNENWGELGKLADKGTLDTLVSHWENKHIRNLIGRDSKLKSLSKHTWNDIRNKLKEQDVLLVIVMYNDGGGKDKPYVLSNDLTKVYNGSFYGNKRTNQKIIAIVGKKDYGDKSAKSEYESLLNNPDIEFTSVNAVYTDLKRLEKHKKRQENRSGYIPLPNSQEYRKYIRNLKNEFSDKVVDYINNKLPVFDTIEELKSEIKSKLPSKVSFKGMLLEKDTISINGRKYDEKNNTSNDRIRYSYLGYRNEYMEEFHPTLERSSDEYIKILKSIPRTIDIYIELDGLTLNVKKWEINYFNVN